MVLPINLAPILINISALLYMTEYYDVFLLCCRTHEISYRCTGWEGAPTRNPTSLPGGMTPYHSRVLPLYKITLSFQQIGVCVQRKQFLSCQLKPLLLSVPKLSPRLRTFCLLTGTAAKVSCTQQKRSFSKAQILSTLTYIS